MENKQVLQWKMQMGPAIAYIVPRVEMLFIQILYSAFPF